MKFPKRLDPHPLRDTYVQIRYTAVEEMSFELLKGLLYQKFNSKYTFENTWDDRTLRINSPVQISFGTDYSRLKFRAGDHRAKTVQLDADHLLFNAGRKYEGWDNYRIFIKEVLELMLSIDEITHFSWVGLRYVSEFKGINILDKLRDDFCFFSSDSKYKNTTFRTEYELDGTRVVLNLASNLSYSEAAPESGSKYSLTDIDVSKSIDTCDLYRFGSRNFGYTALVWKKKYFSITCSKNRSSNP